MAVTVQDITDILEAIAPQELAESWDNVGLMLGSPADPVTSILIGLDPSPDLVDEAAEQGADLIITHHPVIFHPLSRLQTDRPETRTLLQAARHNISLLACHTNLDAAPHGVNEILARRLGLETSTPLMPTRNKATSTPACGLGRIGSYPAPVAATVFIDKLKQCCNPPWLLHCGRRPEFVTRVAVCGGSCSEFAVQALAMGADVFITAEVKHSVARWAENAGLWIIDAGHFATEQAAMPDFAEMLRQKIHAAHIDVTVALARQTSPLQML